MITDGKKVKIHYTLRVEGKVVDSSKGHDPLIYLHGTESLIPGLQKGLLNHKAGERCRFVIGPEEAYGVVDQSAITEVPFSALPKGKLKIGYVVTAEGPDGNLMHASVKEIRTDTVMLDFNHPLAGKTLQFDVEILEVI